MATKVFVGNLTNNVTEHNLRETFERFGSIDRISTITHREPAGPRGFAFVTFLREDDAEEAVVASMNDRWALEVCGHPCVVQWPRDGRRPAHKGFGVYPGYQRYPDDEQQCSNFSPEAHRGYEVSMRHVETHPGPHARYESSPQQQLTTCRITSRAESPDARCGDSPDQYYKSLLRRSRRSGGYGRRGEMPDNFSSPNDSYNSNNSSNYSSASSSYSGRASRYGRREVGHPSSDRLDRFELEHDEL